LLHSTNGGVRGAGDALGVGVVDGAKTVSLAFPMDMLAKVALIKSNATVINIFAACSFIASFSP
jgi:hypothetical protein